MPPKKTRLIRDRNRYKNADLEALLAAIQVEENIDNIEGVKGWNGVSNSEGVFAYFGDIELAYHFRLVYINLIINAR